MQSDALVQWSFFPGGIQIPRQAFISLALGAERRQAAKGKRPGCLETRSSSSSGAARPGDPRSLTSEGEGESGKQTECCSGDFSLPPLGPLPTVFIDFNHWRLAGSQKKHCVMCSFLAFIKETQCSAVTLPSSPGNLPTPCGTSFIGGDGARGFALVYLFFFFFLILQQGFQNSLCSAFYLLSQPKGFLRLGRNCQRR